MSAITTSTNVHWATSITVSAPETHTTESGPYKFVRIMITDEEGGEMAINVFGHEKIKIETGGAS